MRESFLILTIEYSAMPLHRFPGNLKGIPHRIAQAFNGKSGLQLVLSGNPDLVLLDLDLPDMNGLEFLKSLRRDDVIKDIPVIVIGATRQKEMAQQAMQQGAVDFVLKPYQMSELEENVIKILKNTAGQKQAAQQTEHSITVARSAGRTILRFAPGWARNLRSEIKRIFTGPFVQRIKGDQIIIDVRTVPEISSKEAEVLEKFVHLFKNQEVLILSGRHFGTLVAETELDDLDRVHNFITLDELNNHLARTTTT
ncbi:MAG: response regulator [Leptospiraceae bacterium]|nr:response regulator [Leptospiraceae bacterium]